MITIERKQRPFQFKGMNGFIFNQYSTGLY